MSCINSTAPVDIDINNIAGKCDLKCNYNFQYNNSACIATNKGTYISLSYDNTSNPSVIYNSSGYNVKEVRLYSPSIHTYNGARTEAELVIIHNSITGLNPLLVCVPIKLNDVDAVDSTILSIILKTTSNNAPNEDETTNVNIQNYNLNAFVPKTSYFSYKATLMYQPCDGNIDYIVFSPSQKYINISTNALEILQNITTKHKYRVSNNPSKLYFNTKGSKAYTTNNDIYIDCQPVTQENSIEQENVIFTGTNASSSSKPTDIMKNKYFQFFLGMLFFLLIFFIVSRLFKFGGKFINNNIGKNLLSNPFKVKT